MLFFAVGECHECLRTFSAEDELSYSPLGEWPFVLLDQGPLGVAKAARTQPLKAPTRKAIRSSHLDSEAHRPHRFLVLCYVASAPGGHQLVVPPIWTCASRHQ